MVRVRVRAAVGGDEVGERLVEQQRDVLRQRVEQLAQGGRRHVGAGRVVRVAERDRARARGDRRQQPLDVVAVRHRHRARAGALRHHGVEAVGGPRRQQLVLPSSRTRAAAASSCAAPWPTATRSGSTPLRRAQLAAQLLRGRVRLGVQRPARRVGDGVDDVRVRQLVPGRAREVEHVDARERAAALLLGLRAQLLSDLFVGHAGELPVVVEQAHARHQPPIRPLTLMPASSAPLKNEEPDAEGGRADHAADHEDAADHALALVVPGGAAHEDPGEVEPFERHQAQQQPADHRRERDEQAEPDAVGDVLGAAAEEQAGERQRAPEAEVHEHHQRKQPDRDDGVAVLASVVAASRGRPVLDRARPGAAGDEEAAGV